MGHFIMTWWLYCTLTPFDSNSIGYIVTTVYQLRSILFSVLRYIRKDLFMSHFSMHTLHKYIPYKNTGRLKLNYGIMRDGILCTND